MADYRIENHTSELSTKNYLDPQLLRAEQREAPALALFAGNCHCCPNRQCTRIENKPCRYPTLIRPSLEAYGFDIAKTTATALGLELKWGKDGCLPPYFILVSGLMSSRRIPHIRDYLTDSTQEM